MIYLVRFNENFTNGLYSDLLIIISLLSLICGILVIISKNPIVSVLFLIGLFLTIASYLMVLGISFIGLSYLLVYVGAVSILFLFILMLINVRVSELVTDNNNSIPLSILTIAIFSVVFDNKIPLAPSFNLFSLDSLFYYMNNKENTPNSKVSYASSHNWDTSLAEVSHITSIGNILYTSYPMLLLITSIILMLSMIGSIIITIKQ